MTDRKELIQRLQELADRLDRECISGEGVCLDAIAALSQSQWISVDDKLPDPHEQVLFTCTDHDDICCGFRNYAGVWFDETVTDRDCEAMMVNAVSWHPLPAPPDGE